MSRITPFIWFEHQAEEAARYYVSIFRNSSIDLITRYDAASAEASGKPEGSVMTVAFKLDGQEFTALNGGEYFKLTGAISFVVPCESQAEIDDLWEKLSAGGQPMDCGWVTDRYGVTWQIMPARLSAWLSDPDPAKSRRVMQALLKMKKLDIDVLRRAYDA